MKHIYNAVKISLLASIATMFIKTWSLYGTPLKISDVFLFISFILLIVLIAKKNISITPPIFKHLIYFVTLFFILVLGTFTSLLLYGHLPFHLILLSYLRIMGCMFAFIEIIILGKEDKKFIEYAVLSFLFSFLVIPMAYIFPQFISNGLLMDSSNARFAGLFNDPNYYSNFSIIPIMVSLFLFTKEEKLRYKIIFFVLISMSLGFLVWTGSRSGWLGMIGAIFVFLFFEYKANGFKKLRWLFPTILLALCVGMFLIPATGQKQTRQRAQTLFSQENTNPNKKSNTIPYLSTLTKEQDRGAIWKQSLLFLKKNSIGYGPSYNNIIDIENNGPHRAVHNFMLESVLLGGIPLIFLFVFIFKKEKMLNCIIKPKNYFLLSAILGVFISCFFLDSFESRWVWIIVAIFITAENAGMLLYTDALLVKENYGK